MIPHSGKFKILMERTDGQTGSLLWTLDAAIQDALTCETALTSTSLVGSTVHMSNSTIWHRRDQSLLKRSYDVEEVSIRLTSDPSQPRLE